ncbi:IS66 family insertion sequence element accessory protein TnpB [Myxococcus sp. K15C18031901]|uniref:IS66 family insertion sequence element accessory protein TnpA n=1 Tax=Myxococcus dinghuensis TaxID=2906761 RepID=UPI0020A7F373|nr:IS66 family insertion sequence element accessory protein TnpB [Myxococcus dinghuensis]MCP3103959.1 IS66 family insertion sequence element accessory protein TnpB [Myxococcus dinghuensis]
MSKPGEKQEWSQVAEAFEASGLTQKAFSAQRGVRLSTLQSWVYRRRRQHARKAPAVRLLPVEVPAVAQVGPMLLEVVLASGARLRFPAGADVEYVARLVTALGW